VVANFTDMPLVLKNSWWHF